jgi:hypothetical protein
LLSLNRVDHPFKHAFTDAAFDGDLADELRDSVVGFEDWETSEDGFYRNSLAHFTSDSVPDTLSHLLTPEVSQQVHEALQETFQIRLRPGAQMMLNRFDTGDGTLVHNDFLQDDSHRYFFTHRALLYLNESWDPTMGGVLGIFDDAQATSPVATIEPRHNTMSAMAMGPASYHAVSAQSGPARFSIVWSFCTVDRSHQL